MTYQTLLVETSPRKIMTVTLNRPERGNSYSPEMLDEIGDLLTRLHESVKERVVIVRGAGKHFSTGADVTGERNHEPRFGLHEVLHLLDTVPIPTIALVHGGCIGGGAAFAACCDVILASEGAFFSIPEVRIGIPPVLLAPYFIRAMGYRSFRRYGMSGERIGAAEADRIGLAQLCETDALERAGLDLADAFLLGAPNALKDLKAANARLAGEGPPLGEDRTHVLQNPEFLEGKASFKEKRKPNWYPAP